MPTFPHLTPPASSAPFSASLCELLAARRCRLYLLLGLALVMACSMGFRIDQIQSSHLALQHESARNVARTILAMRAWNSQAGAVYVPVSPELRPNPFLHHPRRELRSTDGQTLTMVNPAYMTRLVSEILAQTSPLRVSLRSLRPLNPGNRPDPWETEALHRFENGAEEFSGEFLQADGTQVYRFMLPVKTEESCLGCHAAQGDRLGEIRGGLSLTLPADTQARHTEIVYVVLRHLFAFALLGGACYGVLGLLGRRWTQERQAIEKDKLTEKMLSLERLVQRFCEELRDPLQQSIRSTAQNAEDIAAVGHRLEQTDGPDSPVLAVLPKLQEKMGETLAGLQELMHRLNSLRHASLSLGEEAQRLDLAELLTEILQARASSYRHCAQIEVICAPHTEITCVSGLFDQILGILISNSIEHGFMKGARHGHIRIETERLPDGTLLISYADDGVGMPPERLACVFDPFPEPTGPDHRQGLSLYICYSLVTFRLGGSIRCDSVLGGGTHFLITLPGTPSP